MKTTMVLLLAAALIAVDPGRSEAALAAPAAGCGFSARHLTLAPGETFALDFSFRNPTASDPDTTFTAVMLENDFYGPRHTYLVRNVGGGTGVNVNTHLTTGAAPIGTDDVTIQVTSSHTGATILATCTTRLTVSGDTDLDGILDEWETSGIDGNGDGVTDLTLTGANRRRKDIYLELDHMRQHDLLPAAGQDVVAAFAAAPVVNPDGSTGITLHIDQDEELAHEDDVTTWTEFDTIKAGAFGTVAERARPEVIEAKRRVYHYVMFGHERDGDTSSGRAEIHGNDVLVTLGGAPWGMNAAGHHVGTVREQAGTLMHEFGHNLGLRHGGADDTNCKPNYISVMGYSFQTTLIPQVAGPNRLDYSRGALTELKENSLLESDGVGAGGTDFTFWSADGGAGGLSSAQANGWLDWNENNSQDAARVPVDINNLGFDDCRASPGQTLTGHDDWANLDYNFRDDPDYADGAHSPTPPEITGEVAAEIRERVEQALAPKAEAGGPYTGVENAPVAFTGGATGTGTLTYAWDFGDGTTGTGAQATHVYGDDGTFTVTLTVTDQGGRTGKDTAAVTVANLAPAVAIEGPGTRVARAGVAAEWAARGTDPGSDDLTVTWTWGDGQSTSTAYLIDPPGADPDPSPDVRPRDVRDVARHTWTRPCVYGVRVTAADDDGGRAADEATLVVTGDGGGPRLLAFWALRMRPGGAPVGCLLRTVEHMSRVFSEVVDVSTRDRAFTALTPRGIDPRRQLDAQLLTAWLNFADGAHTLDELVDGDGDQVPDTSFATAMARAEAVRLDPAATPAAIAFQVSVLNGVNV
ncbi:PKD domain-containing protein [Nonomuraea sp. NPDC059007]|uniref:PKD domain-containing protein n=1 Tax=Nonomuraea sp. NPDC059007 TaxID=3346692 RepID=UPI0036AACC4E